MDEPALDLAQVPWSRQKEMVRVFYKEMWDHANTTLVPRIFHPDFTFRGSLGPTLVGHERFIGYVEFVTGALGEYTSDILAVAEEGNRVFAKLRFHGYHRRELFGVPPSGRHVCGMACHSSPSTVISSGTCGFSAIFMVSFNV